ncbi:WASH complex subunit 3 [Danaus plexippus]|nr:WASH complex subunit 3 [Danaus plexippus]
MPDIMNHEVSDVDLSKIAALQQKRTLAFVNHFVITTVQFLNNFSKKCEQRLMQFERKIEKINATMVLLEAKLSSIPELNNITGDETRINVKEEELKPKESKEVIEESKNESDQKDKTNTVENGNTEGTAGEHVEKIKKEYERFVKMVQVGVPTEAVKLKISLEGLDPSELDRILYK